MATAQESATISKSVTVTVDDTAGPDFTWWPNTTGFTPPLASSAAQTLTEGQDKTGALLGVTARVVNGGDITMGDTTIWVARDLRTYPNGGDSSPATAMLLSNAREERIVYQSATATPTPSATAADWNDRFEQEPFSNGLWIAVDHTGGSGTGTTEVIVTLLLRVDP